MEERSEFEYTGRAGQQPARKKRRRRKPVYKIVIEDVLMTAFVLLVFAMFHHVIPRMTASRVTTPEPVKLTTPTPTAEIHNETVNSPDNGVNEQGSVEAAANTPQPTPEPTHEPTPEPELTWKEKFAEHFTDDVVVTENSYTSPNIAVNITTHTTEYTDVAQSRYYVADIYISDMECFKTEFANGSFGYYSAQNAVSLSKSVNAVLAINGDYADNQRSGFLVRNGELYYDEQIVYDLCVIYEDGTMETYGPGEYDVQDIISRSPLQSFKFGPELLENGVAKTSFNCTNEIAYEEAPRAALGYYEPGHYCFVAVDGRGMNGSRGLEIKRLADLFQELGCVSAYNLDGGASAVMTFMGSKYSSPSNGGRDIGEILYIRDWSEEG